MFDYCGLAVRFVHTPSGETVRSSFVCNTCTLVMVCMCETYV